MDIRAFGLLHLCETESTAVNLAVSNFRSQINVYVDCAVTLAKSLQRIGIPFSLLTNNEKFLRELVEAKHAHLDIIEIPFSTKVPTGTRFYSSHFKLDVFRYFARSEHNYVALCDLDMVCVGAAPVGMKNLVEGRVPLFYDISDQSIPAYGANTICKDLETIHGIKSEGRWSGGEFLAGPPEFFDRLMTQIEKIYGNYIDNMAGLHHVGDEAVVSAALELLRRGGHYIADAGTLGIVGRYWSVKTLHSQRSFKHMQDSFLLHLPADKPFIARAATWNEFEPSRFKLLYRQYDRSPAKVARRLAKSLLMKL